MLNVLVFVALPISAQQFEAEKNTELVRLESHQLMQDIERNKSYQNVSQKTLVEMKATSNEGENSENEAKAAAQPNDE